MSKPLFIWRIPEPPAEEVEAYLGIGWIRYSELGEPWLLWSFAKGTPQWPGGYEELKRRLAERDGK